MIRGTDHLGHREAAGSVAGLFWDRSGRHDEFCVEVKDRSEGTRFVLYLATRREAIQAFYHPFPAPAGTLAGPPGWAHGPARTGHGRQK